MSHWTTGDNPPTIWATAVDEEMTKRPVAAAPPPPATDEEIVERCIAAAKEAMKTTKDMPIATVVRAVLALVAPHYTQQGWEKGREQAAKIAASTVADGDNIPWYAPEQGGKHPADAYGNMRAFSIVASIRAMKQET